MPPNQEFYLRPTEADFRGAKRWKNIEHVTQWGPERKVMASFFPCKITTAKEQELFASIRLSDYEPSEGEIEIPFGIWDEGHLDPEGKLKIIEAQKMQNIILIGANNLSDFTRYEILGIDKDRSRNFFIYPSRTILEALHFTKQSDLYLRYKEKRWPAKEIQVEGIVRDFQDDFPGWKIEPVALNRKNN